jgi:hypothetical protein
VVSTGMVAADVVSTEDICGCVVCTTTGAGASDVV